MNNQVNLKIVLKGNHNSKQRTEREPKRTMSGKWQIVDGVKYEVEDSEVTTTHIVENPFFQNGEEWDVVKGLTPEDVMKILKKQQDKNKQKEKEEKKKEQKGKQRSLGFSRQNGAGKHWIPE